MADEVAERRTGRRRRVGRAMAVCAACAVAYYVVLTAFSDVSLFSTNTQIRPASGLSPVVSLYLGVPAALGCSLANLVADARSGLYDPAMLPVYFVIQLVYNLVPYYLWYLIGRHVARLRENPFPDFSASACVGLFVALVIFDSVLVSALLIPFEPEFSSALFNQSVVHIMNNFIFACYLGIPLVIVLARSPLQPSRPRFVRQPYVRRPPSLTQRATMLFVAVVLVWNVVAAGGYLLRAATESRENFAAVVNQSYLAMAVLTLVSFVGLSLGLRLLERHVTLPLESLTDAARAFVDQVRRHEEHQQPVADTLQDDLGARPIREIADLADATANTHRDVVEYIRKFGEASRAAERVHTEMEIARGIQQSALPRDFAAIRERYGVDVDAFMRPAREVGGDFYDVFEASPGSVGFIVADVSGKGTPAALFMMRAQSVLRFALSTCEDVGEALTLANRRLCEHNEQMLFVTAFVCVLDVASGAVSFSNAGHCLPVVAQSATARLIDGRPGLVLGATPKMTFCTSTVALAPGQSLTLYTDGVTEATNPSEELFGEDRLLEVVAATAGGEARRVNEALVSAIDEFAGQAEQFDDITLLTFARGRAGEPPAGPCQ